ncbi:MAG: hypothetical protein EP343_03240 [Deltaproteobacteria bacterium]|nr:MAG: hypothetical protein EP343_03240 [Deltaproteobacteria bacterium]
MRRILNLCVLCVVLVGSVGVGCGVVDDYVDCNKICNRYRDCVNSQYDSGKCIDRCFDESRSNPDYNRKANDCSACLETRACSESLPCTVQCAGIVP